VAWYWAFRGVMDIRAALAEEPFKPNSKQEFAFVCNMMWMDIFRHIFRVDWTQDASVFRRNINSAAYTQMKSQITMSPKLYGLWGSGSSWSPISRLPPGMLIPPRADACISKIGSEGPPHWR
jgi:hypothetical protein